MRRGFDSRTKKYIGKEIKNKNGKSAVFTKVSQREIKSNLKHSKENGFSVKEHFEIANKVISVYKGSDFIKRHGDKKNGTKDVFMERFLSREISLSTGNKTRVCTTIKDAFGKKSIYSIELMKPDTAMEQTKKKGT